MNLDFKEVDKSNFKCFTMPDGSVYFGELEYMNEKTNELVYNFDELTEEQKQDVKVVRHGNGVQLFTRTEGGVQPKYAGQWDRDRKNGEGQCTYEDGSEYRGHFTNDKFDGYGSFTWAPAVGHQYEGYWKDGKMEGGGEFRHKSGHKLKGIFKNNLYNHKNKAFLCPFNEAEFNKKYLQNRKLFKVEE